MIQLQKFETAKWCDLIWHGLTSVAAKLTNQGDNNDVCINDFSLGAVLKLQIFWARAIFRGHIPDILKLEYLENLS